ncbi:hypothetical protein AAHC03_013827 [Spirometra sp. Aus1]
MPVNHACTPVTPKGVVISAAPSLALPPPLPDALFLQSHPYLAHFLLRGAGVVNLNVYECTLLTTLLPSCPDLPGFAEKTGSAVPR